VSETTTVRSFLPWVRQGISAGLPSEDTLGRGLPARAQVPLDLWVNDPNRARPDEKLHVPLRFYGPGDVGGIDPGQVVRVEPRHLSTDFEPNCLPLVEFDRPDFPWLFTPARANAAGRLRPWIALVVVEKGPATVERDPRAPLPVLDAPRSELPDLADSWAWAHAQVTRVVGPGSPDGLAEMFRRNPERTVARLVCGRRLRAQTPYLACVVPTFASGRDAGLGVRAAADGQELAPAWDAAGSPDEHLRLPVYYHWEFTTGLGGDFEELVRRLQPRELPPEVGTLPLDVSAPGWGLAPRPRAASLPLTAALRRAEQGPDSEAEVDAKLRADLRRALEGGAGPDVAPPIYGQWYTREPGLPADGAPPQWLRELNMDPRMRVAAGLGALVVRYEQERLMAEAWDQLARHEAAAKATARTQLAEEVSSALHDKHFGSILPDRLVQLAGPALGAAAAVPQADPAFRGLLGPGGAIGQRLGDGAPATAAAAEAAVAGPPEAAAAASEALAAAQRLADGEATGELEFAPEFPQPMYESLRDWFEGMLLPGLDLVPPNTVAVLETNERFIEAFLVGLNHEFSRELVWRGYPTTRRGTYFRRFWDTRGGSEAAGVVPPIRTWPAESRLGSHLAGAAGQGQLVLLVRGDVLNRFPRAVVYAVEAEWAPDGTRRLGTNERYPLFRGSSRGDVTFVGFGLSEEEARGATGPPGSAGWFFVIQEQPVAPRFGFDEAGGNGPSAPGTWNDLTWADVDLSAGSYVVLGGRLANRTLPASAGPSPSATWGANAAHMAVISQQAPFRMAVHASAWLPVRPVP
jgi:hypothetical protein